jgi:endonuclease/exonuclease/phosphatase family metal-dependent hydrolase
MSKSIDTAELVSTNLRGWAEKRLEKLDAEQLDALAIAMGAAEKPLDLSDNKMSVIKVILERKKERGKERAPSPLVPCEGKEASKEDQEEAATLLQSRVKEKYKGIFVSRHQLKIMSFNSLKMRVGRVGLQEQWLAFSAMMGEFDVVCMSEVPAKNAKERAETLLQLIKSCFAKSEDCDAPEFELHISEPCGPGNLEVHVAFVRKPLKVLATQTLTVVEGVKMDHAPLQLVLEDPRFALSKQLVLTHVHMPPSGRKADRDMQLRLLLRCYPNQAALRGDTPFHPKAAKERKREEVTHVICGDFNVYPSHNEYALEKHGWADPLLPERVSTSAGSMSYDNFLIDRHAASRLSTFSDVLELMMPQNSSKGEIGLSDHDPIVLTIKELPLSGRRPVREVSASPLQCMRTHSWPTPSHRWTFTTWVPAHTCLTCRWRSRWRRAQQSARCHPRRRRRFALKRNRPSPRQTRRLTPRGPSTEPSASRWQRR